MIIFIAEATEDINDLNVVETVTDCNLVDTVLLPVPEDMTMTDIDNLIVVVGNDTGDISEQMNGDNNINEDENNCSMESCISCTNILYQPSTCRYCDKCERPCHTNCLGERGSKPLAQEITPYTEKAT